jgi:hypothetical protein
MMNDYFGLPLDVDAEQNVEMLASEYQNKAWFNGANALPDGSGYPDLDLRTATFAQDPVNYAFNSMVHTKMGLGPVSYFVRKTANSQFIYGFQKKPGVTGLSGADLALYNSLDNKPVGIRTAITSGAKNLTYIFSFPLSYMHPQQVRTLMNKIYTEALNNR